LHRRRGDFPKNIFTTAEFVSAVRQRSTKSKPDPTGQLEQPASTPASPPPGKTIIQAENLTHYYMRDTPLQVKAVTDVNLELYAGEILGVIGHTGSGKSTIIQHFNALLRPHAGRIIIFGQDIGSDNTVDVKNIRRKVGLVFQQPEAQLFEHYVGDDIAYGPRNLKLSREEVRARVKRAMESVGLDFVEFKDRLTFGLSGGEMRRVALAGVLALEPNVLVLDEPTAGLDPQSRQQLMDHILQLHREQALTLVLVSHNMEELARACHRICVFDDGQVVMTGTPGEVFSRPQMLRDMGLGVPPVTDIIDQIRQTGVVNGTGTVLTVEQAAKVLEEVLHEPI